MTLGQLSPQIACHRSSTEDREIMSPRVNILTVTTTAYRARSQLYCSLQYANSNTDKA